MYTMCKIVGMAESLWNLPSQPSCIFCGRKIECDQNAPQFFSQVPGFESGRVRHITLSVDQFRTMLAEGKCQWQSAYRAVVQPLNGTPFLSGVSYRHSGFGIRGANFLAVPRPADTAVLAKGVIHPRGLFWFGKPDTQPNIAQVRQVGWPIHESCWMIAEKCIGRQAIEINIGIFMLALNREHIRKCCDYHINGSLNEASGAFDFLRKDPFNVPALNALSQFVIANPFPITYGPPHRDVIRPRGFRISQGSFSLLPLEIAMEIAEYLSVPDLRNLILAARWKFPDSFWKRRIRPYVFELRDTLARKDVDWQYVGLEYLMIMARQQNGVHHRGRIVHYLARIYATCSSWPYEEYNPADGFVTYLDIPLPPLP